MMHANLCRPIHYFIVAHTDNTINLTWNQINRLMKSLERDNFKILAGDDTGVILLCCLLEKNNLPSELRNIGSLYFFPSNLEVSISKEGLVLLSISGWYAQFDIPYGISRNITQIKPAIRYLEKKLGETVEKPIRLKIVRGTRRCLSEHPEALLRSLSI